MTHGSGDRLSRSVLVIDDEELFCRAMSRLLRRSFFQVLTASDPDQAEQLLAAHSITHLICDFHLGPGFPPGTELVAKWRGQFASIRRALVVTGASEACDHVPAEVDAVVIKGVDPDELVALILGD